MSEKKVAIVMATHDMVQGQQLATRIAVLLDGELMQVGSPGEIFSAPENEKVAEFVGIRNMLPGKVIEHEDNLLTIEVGSGRIQAVSENSMADDVYVMVRPEDITFTIDRTVSSARNLFHGVIKKLTPLGPLVRIEIDCGFPLHGLVTRSAASDLELAIGKNVYASFKATATHVINRCP